MWLGDNIIKITHVIVFPWFIHAMHIQRGNESKVLLSKLRECVELNGAKKIQTRAEAILRDTLEDGGGRKEWRLGVRSMSFRSRGHAQEPAAWGLPSYFPGGRLAFLWHVPSCIFPCSSSLFLPGGRN
jgi:hypothetical protein